MSQGDISGEAKEKNPVGEPVGTDATLAQDSTRTFILVSQACRASGMYLRPCNALPLRDTWGAAWLYATLAKFQG